MKGAREYAEVFETGLYGKLFIESSEHVRGRTFHIYVVSEDGNEKAEVYGIISGQPGWTEKYGWLYCGKWCDDFEKLYKEKKELKEKIKRETQEKKEEYIEEEHKRELEILSRYK